MIQSNDLRLVPGFILRLIFKTSPYKYFRGVKIWPGFFFYKRMWLVDISTLPVEITVAVQHFSVSLNEIDKKTIRRLRYRERLMLMSLMLTIEEVSQLTRISRESIKKAIIFGQIKSVNFGGVDFIPRTELERVLGCIIDQDKLNSLHYR